MSITSPRETHYYRGCFTVAANLTSEPGLQQQNPKKSFFWGGVVGFLVWIPNALFYATPLPRAAPASPAFLFHSVAGDPWLGHLFLFFLFRPNCNALFPVLAGRASVKTFPPSLPQEHVLCLPSHSGHGRRKIVAET